MSTDTLTLRERRRAAGICLRCPSRAARHPAGGTRPLCAPCRQRATDAERERRARLRLESGAPAADDAGYPGDDPPAPAPAMPTRIPETRIERLAVMARPTLALIADVLSIRDGR